MSTRPTTEHDYRVHSLNIHGTFFERWCQHTIRQAPGWKVKRANYPVAFSVPSGPYTASTLDIWAEFKKGDTILSLPIECKKHNPELASWIFFRHREPLMFQNGGLPFITQIDNTLRPAPDVSWDVVMRMNILQSLSCICTDEAREIRSSYLDYKKSEENKRNGGNLSQLTRTANHAITEACQQVALATKAVIHDENIYSVALSNKKDSSFLMPFNKVEIDEHPYLLYEYPLPRFLQSTPQDMAAIIASDGWESIIRLDILIINSNAFGDMLSKLANRII
jgi:hypothetical protein